MKPNDLTDLQRMQVLEALDYKLQAVKRARNQHIVGSKLYEAHSEQVIDLTLIISLFGG